MSFFAYLFFISVYINWTFFLSFLYLIIWLFILYSFLSFINPKTAFVFFFSVFFKIFGFPIPFSYFVFIYFTLLKKAWKSSPLSIYLSIYLSISSFLLSFAFPIFVFLSMFDFVYNCGFVLLDIKHLACFRVLFCFQTLIWQLKERKKERKEGRKKGRKKERKKKYCQLFKKKNVAERLD